MNWGEFAKEAPDLAAEGERRFDASGVILLGSLTKDGSPRISPVEPLIFEGLLLLGMMWQSKKALDLLRDPRCLVHSTISDRHGKEGEFKVRGRATDVQDAGLRERYAVAMSKKIDIELNPEDDFHLFAIEIESVTLISYDTEKQHIQRWP